MKDDSSGTALTTGVASGIGATYADRLARRGCDLAQVARDGKRMAHIAARRKAAARAATIANFRNAHAAARYCA